MFQGRHRMLLAGLLAVTVVAALASSVRGVADVGAWILFTEPISLDSAFAIANAGDLEVLEYRREIPIVVQPGTSTEHVVTQTYEVTLTEPYTGTTAMSQLRGDHWDRYTSLLNMWKAEAEVGIAQTQPSVPQYLLDESAELHAQLTAVAAITGCWNSGTCPTVPDVARLTVAATLEELEAVEDEPLVGRVYITTPQGDGLSLWRKQPLTDAFDAIVKRTSARPVEAYTRPPHDFYHWAPTRLLEMWWKRSGQLDSHPSNDQWRQVNQYVVFTSVNLMLYQQSEDEYQYEQDFVLNNTTGGLYDTGTWLEHSQGRFDDIFGTFVTLDLTRLQEAKLGMARAVRLAI